MTGQIWGKDETTGLHEDDHQMIRKQLVGHLNRLHHEDLLMGIASNATLAELEAVHAAIHGWETVEIASGFGPLPAGTLSPPYFRRVTQKIVWSNDD